MVDDDVDATEKLEVSLCWEISEEWEDGDATKETSASAEALDKEYNGDYESMKENVGLFNRKSPWRVTFQGKKRIKRKNVLLDNTI